METLKLRTLSENRCLKEVVTFCRVKLILETITLLDLQTFFAQFRIVTSLFESGTSCAC